VHVDAKVGRQFAAGIGGLATFADAGMPVLVLHLGTNGPVTDALFDRAMAAAGGTPRVIVLTVQLPDVPRYAYEAGTNDVLRRGTVRYGAVLVDWHAATEGRRDVLRRDGIHLTAAGEELYASLVAAAL
jgi:hypothetical protein